MGKSTRRSIRLRIRAFLYSEGPRPAVRKLNKDSYSVFKEFGLNAEDFATTKALVKKHLGVDTSNLTEEQLDEFERDLRKNTYRLDRGKPIKDDVGKLPDLRRKN